MKRKSIMESFESLKSYVVKNEEDFKRIVEKIYMLMDTICDDYPKHKEWFYTKQSPETINGDERNILFVRNPEDDNEIVAIACLKKNEEEQKLCTLYVSDKCRRLGIGIAIIKEAMKWLGTTKPLITFANYKLEMFKPIIEKYNWELTEIISDLYNNRFQELCFNGRLTKNNVETLERQLHKKLIRILKNRCEHIKF